MEFYVRLFLYYIGCSYSKIPHESGYISRHQLGLFIFLINIRYSEPEKHSIDLLVGKWLKELP